MLNGVKYENNFARSSAYFAATSAPRTEGKTRQAAYDFIMGIYKQLSEEPETLGLKPLDDVYFGPWEQQKGRQKDVKTIRDSVKKTESLISGLYDLVDNSDVDGDLLVLKDATAKLNRTLDKAITAQGAVRSDGTITLPVGCAQGLKELSEISKANIIHITDGPLNDKAFLLFSRCVYEPESDWLVRAFDSAMGANGELLRLCGELEKRGYKRVDCKDGKRMSLDYIKQYGTKEEPLKMSWADRTHYGIEITYEDLKLEPCFIWLRMAAFKSVLARCDSFPEKVSDFIANHTKTCDGCRYCVQTDKTGQRPLAAVKVGKAKKCPYYPSFSMNWRELTSELADDFIAVLDAAYDEENNG